MSDLRLIIHGEMRKEACSLFIHKLEKLVARYHTDLGPPYLGKEVPVLEATYDGGKMAYIGIYGSLIEANHEIIEISKVYADAESTMEVKQYECKFQKSIWRKEDYNE